MCATTPSFEIIPFQQLLEVRQGSIVCPSLGSIIENTEPALAIHETPVSKQNSNKSKRKSRPLCYLTPYTPKHAEVLRDGTEQAHRNPRMTSGSFTFPYLCLLAKRRLPASPPPLAPEQFCPCRAAVACGVRGRGGVSGDVVFCLHPESPVFAARGAGVPLARSGLSSGRHFGPEEPLAVSGAAERMVRDSPGPAARRRE